MQNYSRNESEHVITYVLMRIRMIAKRAVYLLATIDLVDTAENTAVASALIKLGHIDVN